MSIDIHQQMKSASQAAKQPAKKVNQPAGRVLVLSHSSKGLPIGINTPYRTVQHIVIVAVAVVVC